MLDPETLFISQRTPPIRPFKRLFLVVIPDNVYQEELDNNDDKGENGGHFFIDEEEENIVYEPEGLVKIP